MALCKCSTLSLAIRSQEDNAQSSPRRPERNTEEDHLSCVYDNDFANEIRRPTQHYQNNATLQREGEMQLRHKVLTAVKVTEATHLEVFAIALLEILKLYL